MIDTPKTASASLQALEALTGRHAENIGKLPRSAFLEPAQLEALGRKCHEGLEDLLSQLDNRRRRSADGPDSCANDESATAEIKPTRPSHPALRGRCRIARTGERAATVTRLMRCR